MKTYLVPTWVLECCMQREGYIIMVKAADAQATVEALQAQVKELEAAKTRAHESESKATEVSVKLQQAREERDNLRLRIQAVDKEHEQLAVDRQKMTGTVESLLTERDNLRAELERVRGERDNYRAVLEGAEYEQLEQIGQQPIEMCRALGQLAKQRYIDLAAALDAERQRARTVTQLIVAEIGASGPESLESAAGRMVAHLSQLQALVRALPVQEVDPGLAKVVGVTFAGQAAEATAHLMTYRATLDATTPAKEE